MRRFPSTAFIVVLAVVGLVVGWRLFAHDQTQRFAEVARVRNSTSQIRMTYTIERAKGPIAREQWYLENLDGHSRASYAVTDRNGSTARFNEPIPGYDVTFRFEKLVQDGIWQLQSRPYRGKNLDVHTVRIEQVADKASGSHEFRFTDPHYLATSAGREYKIHLDKNKPLPDLLKLDSTSTADPRYLSIVSDFETFGPPQFQRTIAAARTKLLKS